MTNEKTGSTKPLFIVLGIALIGVLIFILFNTGESPDVTPENGSEVTPPTNGEEEPEVQTPENVDRIIKEAEDNQNPSLCEGIEDEGNRKWCTENAIATEALKKSDHSVCNRIEDEQARIICKDEVIVHQAYRAKDPSLCAAITDQAKAAECRDLASQ